MARDYDHLFKLLIIGDSGECVLECEDVCYMCCVCVSMFRVHECLQMGEVLFGCVRFSSVSMGLVLFLYDVHLSLLL